jgi:hypothetical protein
MKRILYLTFLILQFTLCTELTRAQYYIPSTPLNFYTQTGLDNYFAANPGITAINGISLLNGGMDPILNTNALSNVTSIGTLVLNWFDPIAPSIDVSGLNNLTDIDTLWTYSNVDFDFASNITNLDLLVVKNFYEPLGVNFEGFDNLETAGEIYLNLNQPSAIVVNAFPSLHTVNQLMVDSDLGSIAMGTGDIGSFDGFNSVTSLQDLTIGDYGLTFTSLSICNAVTQLENYRITTWQPGPPTGNSMSCQNLALINNFMVSGGPYPFTSVEAQSINNLYIDGYTNSIAFPNLTQVGNIELYPFAPIQLDFPLLNSTDNVLIYVVASLAGIQEVTMNIPQLTSIDGDFSMSSTSNTSLDFLENLVSIGGTILLEDNPNLSACNIDAICSKLSIAPNDVTIVGNTGACTELADVAAACIIPTITGHVYYDLNCNQSFDPEDVPVTYPLINDTNNNLLGSSYENGNYTIVTPPNGQITFAPIAPLGTLPATPITVDTDAMTGNMVIDFPLCPNGDYHDVEVTAALSTVVRPGFYSWYPIHLKNNSYYTETVQLTVDISLFANYPNWNTPLAYTIVGSSIVFDPITLEPFEQIYTYVYGTLSYSTPLGTPSLMTASVSILNTDLDLTNNTSQVNTTVVGSYDPNDIMVNKPLIDVEEADADGDWLTYRIRFQNTGTFPAEFISVVSEQDELVDMTTIQMIDASHSNVWSFDGREVTWFFENIQLPDSLSDPEGSQGYIIYKVRTIAGLGVGDILDVNAAIYFDYNEPVITNSATTEYYLCPEDLVLQTNTPVVCENGIAGLSASDGYDSYSWSFGEQVLSSIQTLNYAAITPGTYTITCAAIGTPDVCQSSATIDIQVNATPAMPVISQDQNTLTATGTGTFVWTLDGELLNETSNTLEITQTGNYSVYIDGICPSEVASGTYAYVGVEDINTIEISMYPNPANEVIYLQNASLMSSIEVLDLTGRICLTSTATTRLIELPIDDLSSGTYTIRVVSQNGIWSEHFIKE